MVTFPKSLFVPSISIPSSVSTTFTPSFESSSHITFILLDSFTLSSAASFIIVLPSANEATAASKGSSSIRVGIISPPIVVA